MLLLGAGGRVPGRKAAPFLSSKFPKEKCPRGEWLLLLSANPHSPWHLWLVKVEYICSFPASGRKHWLWGTDIVPLEGALGGACGHGEPTCPGLSSPCHPTTSLICISMYLSLSIPCSRTVEGMGFVCILKPPILLWGIYPMKITVTLCKDSALRMFMLVAVKN